MSTSFERLDWLNGGSNKMCARRRFFKRESGSGKIGFPPLFFFFETN